MSVWSVESLRAGVAKVLLDKMDRKLEERLEFRTWGLLVRTYEESEWDSTANSIQAYLQSHFCAWRLESMGLTLDLHRQHLYTP